jgi:starch-binding outer membrane protein, SusD/RagB family
MKNIPERKRLTLHWICIWLLPLTIGFSSCEKFLNVPPPKNQLLTPDVFSNDNSATSAVTGIYSDIMTVSNINGYMTVFCGMTADELIPTTSIVTPSYLQFENNALQVNNPDISTTWGTLFPYIYDANACIEGISTSTGMSQAYKNQLTGEAKFIRAFCNFYLVNLFGPVPLVTATDYRVNASLTRSSEDSVYHQIELDLQDAFHLLSSDYSFSSGEKIRPTKWAAAALLARSFLYQQKWPEAIAMADTVIESGLYSLNTNLNDVFLMNSDEAIWQLFPVIPDLNITEGNLFLPSDPAVVPNFIYQNNPLNSFEPGDKRRASWVDSSVVNGQTYFYPYKYRALIGSAPTQYYMILRLAELYLIRAEAYAHLNLLSSSVENLNVIRDRAGLPSLVSPVTMDSCLNDVAHERQVEFMTELGHRWFDLKRTQMAGTVLSPIKPDWQATDTLWPVPLSQINADPFLTQNPGY